ncbi:Cell division control protein 14 [Stagonosporopsis vannaccii]|nr:Cell division control protein 14 [Stagonosporopsis vannaccii]
MEQLLSHSFDNIASKDTAKIRKGLRQIEGMLAHICLKDSKTKSTKDGHRRNQSAATMGAHTDSKKLEELGEDLAFREFFRLQDGFEWNVTTRVADCLERLLGMGSSKNGQNDMLIIAALSNLQGLLLLHPPSRILFGREVYMNLVLDLLDPYNCPAIQSQAILVLVTALLATPQNTRVFEQMEGLLTITSLQSDEETTQSVKVTVLEFLYFYLLPEAPSPSGKLASAFDRRGSTDSSKSVTTKNTRSQEEKQRMLGKYIANVDCLFEDLQDSDLFASVRV